MRATLNTLATLSLAAGLVACGQADKDSAASAPRPEAPVKAAATKAPDHDHAAHASASGAHADHTANHGGTFFMAPDKFHHIEGTLPTAGLFRLHVYDDHTQPLDPKTHTGRVEREGSPAAPLTYDAATRTLTAQLDPAATFPIDLQLWLVMPGMPAGSDGDLYDFQFTSLTVAPAASTSAATAHAHAAGKEHAHGSPHGGQVVEAGTEHHFELVRHGNMVMLYVLDASEGTLSIDGMEAKLLVQAPGAAPKTVTLPAHGDHFMADVDFGQAKAVVATVKIAGSTKTARFDLATPAAPAAAGHDHSPAGHQH